MHGFRTSDRAINCIIVNQIPETHEPRTKVLSPVNSIESRLIQEIECRRVPGVSVAWVVNDGAIHVCSMGKARLNPSLEMSTRSVFPWFSVTKLFTATAVLQLVETGRLNLDECVASYRPDLLKGAPALLTSRQLLSHTSGLANPMPLKWVHPTSESRPDLESMTRRLLSRHHRLRFDPGSRYAYSNLGYLVLGLLIETVSGLSFEEYISRNILKRLGATTSGFDLPADAARGYSRAWSLMGLAARLLIDRELIGTTRGGFTEVRPFEVDGAPYGGLVGPVEGMLTLGRAMLADGRAAHGRVLDASTVRLALTHVRSGDNRTLPVGLGWHLGDSGGEQYANHIGGGMGFRSELRIFPRLGRAVAVIANETSFDTTALAEFVVRGCDDPVGAESR
jgi:CubicO group peptidase (beta-lactamase class C family)